MTSDIATRVAKGVALLDERKPGWMDRINLITLDVQDPNMCILGQLYPVRDDDMFPDGFNKGISALSLCSDAQEHGVDCYPHHDILDQRQDYVYLTQEWKRVIKILRQKQTSEVEVPETVAA